MCSTRFPGNLGLRPQRGARGIGQCLLDAQWPDVIHTLNIYFLVPSVTSDCIQVVAAITDPSGIADHRHGACTTGYLHQGAQLLVARHRISAETFPVGTARHTYRTRPHVPSCCSSAAARC